MDYITSVLDTDLYKLTMQQAVLQHYPRAVVSYRFTNRGGNLFTRECFAAIAEAIEKLSDAILTKEERAWLSGKCPFFQPDYLDYLAAFRFRPKEQVTLEYKVERTDENGLEWGQLNVEVKGGWAETILYEVPIMSIISEAYFTYVDKKWDYTGQLALAEDKGKQLFLAGCIVSEFGTRRRRSHRGQDLVMKGLIKANKEYGSGEGRGKLAGTSNVHFAQMYDLAPIGTIAHEWIMGIAATEGYQGSNGKAMDLWDQTYPSGALSIALTDTFSTKPFFEDFVSNPERGRKWKGLRQDSGDPVKFIDIAKTAFDRVGADPKSKIIVFSDGLDIPRCLDLKKKSDEAGIGCSFGVGTTLTNDFLTCESPTEDVSGEGEIRTNGPKSKALNMVIKLYKINDVYCVKISDELTKNTGDPATVALVKQRFGLEAHYTPPSSPSK